MNRRAFFSFLSGLAVAVFGWPLAACARTFRFKEIIERGEYRGVPWIIYERKHQGIHWEAKFKDDRYGQYFELRDDFDRKKHKIVVDVLKDAMKQSVGLLQRGERI